jgi:ABC-type transport system involved in multi-copper enzyme maturation permease subunit
VGGEGVTAMLTAPVLAGRDVRPSMVTVVRVELRKMVDTRAGRWLVAIVAALCLLLTIVHVTTAHPEDRTFHDIFQTAIAPIDVLLPVVGVLLVTSEWSQRTALVTFALVPQRGRVMLAKVLAGTLLALLYYVFALGLTALAVSAGGAPEGRWDQAGGLAAQGLLDVATSMWFGLAFGALFLNSALAITLHYVLPIATTIVFHIRGLQRFEDWLSPGQNLSFTDHVYDSHDWARAATTLMVWLVLPAVIGWWRVLRADVR